VLIYSAATELITAIGKDRIMTLFFGRSLKTRQPPSRATTKR